MQNIISTVDVVLFTLIDSELKVLLYKRSAEPFNGCWAIPGGYIHENEDLTSEDSARRMLAQKIGCSDFFIEQLGTFANNARDPRGWSISIGYYSLISSQRLNPLLENNLDLRLFSEMEIKKMALPFDHAQIIEAAFGRLKSKTSYSSLPIYFLPAIFTLPQLQKTYESVLGCKLDKSSFRRKIEELHFVEMVSEKDCKTKRPAVMYRAKVDNLNIFNRVI